MTIVKAHEAREVPNPHGVTARALYSGQGAQVIMITLRPGESLKRHVVPVEAIFYVLEGQGIVEIGDEDAEISADHLIACPAHTPHRFRNHGPADLRFLVIKLLGDLAQVEES